MERMSPAQPKRLLTRRIDLPAGGRDVNTQKNTAQNATYRTGTVLRRCAESQTVDLFAAGALKATFRVGGRPLSSADILGYYYYYY